MREVQSLPFSSTGVILDRVPAWLAKASGLEKLTKTSVPLHIKLIWKSSLVLVGIIITLFQWSSMWKLAGARLALSYFSEIHPRPPWGRLSDAVSTRALSTDPMTASADLAWPPPNLHPPLPSWHPPPTPWPSCWWPPAHRQQLHRAGKSTKMGSLLLLASCLSTHNWKRIQPLALTARNCKFVYQTCISWPVLEIDR